MQNRVIRCQEAIAEMDTIKHENERLKKELNEYRSKEQELRNREYNIAVRPGYHCAYMAHETLGSDKTGSVRVSVSYFNRLSEIKYLIDAINKISKSRSWNYSTSAFKS